MAWRIADVAASGEYIQAELNGGVWIDPFGSVDITGMMARLNTYAQGWTPLNLEWVHGLFGFGESLKIYGRATGPVPSETIHNQVVEALNSFWAIGVADVRILVSDSVSTVLPATTESESWSGSLKLVAGAVIIVALVWGLKEVKEIVK